MSFFIDFKRIRVALKFLSPISDQPNLTRLKMADKRMLQIRNAHTRSLKTTTQYHDSLLIPLIKLTHGPALSVSKGGVIEGTRKSGRFFIGIDGGLICNGTLNLAPCSA